MKNELITLQTKNTKIGRLKALLSSIVETTYAFIPIMICIFIMMAYGLKTIDKEIISLWTLPEWSFMSAFMLISMIRERMKRELIKSKPDKNADIFVFIYGSLAILAGVFLALMYASSMKLMPTPSHLIILGYFQIGLLVCAIFANIHCKYLYYRDEDNGERA